MEVFNRLNKRFIKNMQEKLGAVSYNDQSNKYVYFLKGLKKIRAGIWLSCASCPLYPYSSNNKSDTQCILGDKEAKKANKVNMTCMWTHIA